MSDFSSNHGQVLLALQRLIKDLQPDNLSDEEVAIRGHWLHNGRPFRGVTIYDMGEQGDDGTIGTMDIGYVTGIVFADFDDCDSVMSSDQTQTWRELVRRRLKDQRLLVTINNQSSPSEHVCKVIRAGEDLSNGKKYPNYNIKRMLVVVWLRELPTT